MADDAVDRVLRDLGGDPESAVEIEDGTEHFRGGAIRLVLRGSGALEVEHRQAGEERHFSAELPEARVTEIARRLADEGFATIEAPERRLVPGETLVELTVRRGGETVRSVKVPSTDEDVEGILDCFVDLVSEATDGELPPRA